MHIVTRGEQRPATPIAFRHVTPKIARRAAVVAVASLWLGATFGSDAWAANTSVPADLQARLLAKLGAYDRNFRSRAQGTVRILLAVKPDSAKSKLAVANMEAALSKVDLIGGLPHTETTVRYASASDLAEQIRKEQVSIVYVPPGFDDEVRKIGTALGGLSVLSVTPVAEYVPDGIVLGFELVSGKPRLILNLPQAKRQKVDFKSNVLKLMRVYQ